MADCAGRRTAAGGVLPTLALRWTPAVYALDKKKFGYGVARSISTGLRLGLFEGIAWLMWNESRNDGLSAQANASILWASTTAGTVTGGVIGHYLGATPGAASMVESGALWSFLTMGLLTVGVLGDEIKGHHFLLAGAIGLNLGAVGSALVAGKTAPNTTRVRYLDWAHCLVAYCSVDCTLLR